MKLLSLNKKQIILIKFGVWLLILGAIIEASTMYLLHANGYTLHFNRTSSLPERFWIINNNHKSDFHKGDYFSFYAPNDVMLTEGESTPLIKMVAGVAGDSVEIVKTKLLINDVVMGHVWPSTITGHILKPIESQIIKNGCYFAWTPNLYSYDSRYKDVDIVCESDHRIIGSARPLF